MGIRSRLQQRFSPPRLAYMGSIALGLLGGLLIGMAFLAPFLVRALFWLPVIAGVMLLGGATAVAYVAAGRIHDAEVGRDDARAEPRPRDRAVGDGRGERSRRRPPSGRSD